MPRNEKDPTGRKDREKSAERAAIAEVKSEIEDSVIISLIGDLPQAALDWGMQGVSLIGLPINIARAVRIRQKPVPGTLTLTESVIARAHRESDAEYLKRKAQKAARRRTIHNWETGIGAALGTGIGIAKTIIQPEKPGSLINFIDTQVIPHIPVNGLDAFYLQHNPDVINTVILTGLYLISQAGRSAVQKAKLHNYSLRYYNASHARPVGRH